MRPLLAEVGDGDANVGHALQLGRPVYLELHDDGEQLDVVPEQLQHHADVAALRVARIPWPMGQKRGEMKPKW